jgi:mannose-6-phosphate isomerase-like protein (cupin superfamily)
MRNLALLATGILIGTMATTAARQSTPTRGGYVIEQDATVAADEPGPHNGGGRTVAYSFFRSTPGLKLVFRKRALKPGSGIGYHEQREDEIYYVLSGRGQMTLDGKTVDVGPGTAILTRTGSSHGLKQVGTDDLVILINYEQAPPSPASGR